MSVNSNKRKSEQLGMPVGTAANRLRKMILFSLVQKLGLDTCYRCKEPIMSIDDLSIEHIEPWLDSEDPIDLFFDLSNIAFSHMKCNYADARRPSKGKSSVVHGTTSKYRYGCRCQECTRANMLRGRVWRERNK